MSEKCFNPCNPCPPCPPPSFPPQGCFPPPIPPVHIPACGDTSVWGAISQLNERVNQCIGQTNSVISKANETMACIAAAACENGAYYGPNEVWVEEGYDANASSKYFIIHKKAVDSAGCPIRMELKLAYDNTTNSLLKQPVFEASEMESAQFIVPAIPVNPNMGWFGLAIWKDAPIPSTTLTNAYTMGFTKSGRMKWYDNSTDIAQLKRDQIENAMGVYGILVAGGDITDSALRSQIPNADQRLARVAIGQNYDTGEVIILSCGNEDTNGLTSLGCANILKQYGCDVGVEVCQGPTCCALDKGQMLYVPDGHKVPAAYAYWYTTKKATYRTQFVQELADLMQKYGQAIWAANLTYGSVSDIISDITTLDTQVAQHTTEIAALKAGSGSSSTAIAELQSTVTALSSRVETLETTVAQILSDSGSVGAQLQVINQQITNLQASLQQEISDRRTAWTQLQTSLATEITARTNGDAAIQSALNSLSTTVGTNKNDLDSDISEIRTSLATAQSDISQHRQQIETIQSDLQALTATTTSNYNALNGLIQTNTTDVGNLKTQVASLLESMTSLDKAVSDYIIELADIEAALNNIKEANTTILAQQADLLDKYNNLPADLTEFTDRMQSLETAQTELSGKQDALESSQQVLSTRQDTVDTTVQNLETEVDSNTSMIESLQDDMSKRPPLYTYNTQALYVDSINGSDSNSGDSQSAPFKSLDAALNYSIMHREYFYILIYCEKHGSYNIGIHNANRSILRFLQYDASIPVNINADINAGINDDISPILTDYDFNQNPTITTGNINFTCAMWSADKVNFKISKGSTFRHHGGELLFTYCKITGELHTETICHLNNSQAEYVIQSGSMILRSGKIERYGSNSGGLLIIDNNSEAPATLPILMLSNRT